MANLSYKLIILWGFISTWRKSFCDLFYHFQALMYASSPVLLEWLLRATVSGLNIEQFSSVSELRRKQKCLHPVIFNQGRHPCQCLADNVLAAIHYSVVPAQQIQSLSSGWLALYYISALIAFFYPFKLVLFISDHMLKALVFCHQS